MCSERWDWGWNSSLLVSQDDLFDVPSSRDEQWPSGRNGGPWPARPCSAGLLLQIRRVPLNSQAASISHGAQPALKWKRQSCQKQFEFLGQSPLFAPCTLKSLVPGFGTSLVAPCPLMAEDVGPKKGSLRKGTNEFLCKHVNYI